MKTNVLLWSILYGLTFQLCMSQEGSLSVISAPSELTAGDTVQITFAYTSTVNGFYEIQFIPLRSGGNPIWETNVTFDRGPVTITPVGSPNTVTISVQIPVDISGTEDLKSPAAAWGWFGKLDTSLEESGDDYAFFNPFPETYVYPAPDQTLSTLRYLDDNDDIYFNPVTKNLVINTDTISKELKLYDITGTVVMHITPTTKAYIADLFSIPSGIYILTKERSYYKFVIP